MKLHELSTDKTYQIDSYGGIAWRYLGSEMEIREENRYWEDEDGWVWEDEEPEETETGWARMEMIGDDREFIIEPCDISELADDAYCHECGQIGCGHSTGEDDSPNPTDSTPGESLDTFDAASYHELSLADVAGAYEARLNEQFAELGRVTRKLAEEERAGTCANCGYQLKDHEQINCDVCRGYRLRKEGYRTYPEVIVVY